MHCSSCKRTVHKSNTLPSFLEKKERNENTAQQPSPLYTSSAPAGTAKEIIILPGLATATPTGTGKTATPEAPLEIPDTSSGATRSKADSKSKYNAESEHRTDSELESRPINKRRNNSGSPNNKTNEEEIPNTSSRLTGSKADSKSKYNSESENRTNSESENRTNLESENKPKLSESNANTRQRNNSGSSNDDDNDPPPTRFDHSFTPSKPKRRLTKTQRDQTNRHKPRQRTNSDSPKNHENDNPPTPSRQKPKHSRLTKTQTKEATPPTSMSLNESIPPQQKDPNLSVLLNNTRPEVSSLCVEASAPPLYHQIPLVPYPEMPASSFMPMSQNHQNLTPTQGPLYPTLPAPSSLYQPPCNPTYNALSTRPPLSNESLSKNPLPQDPPPYSR
ncbi:hypothetical protein DK880_00335 [Candidatus Cardinium hertigii]|uniref:Uncharacterized protein n=2 Tax=Candidatus Cardinium hertigii TaxID=247481 RepID=A0A2Z3LGX7_9BACT|nr:hypothetical protein DK880_00335 [Candidatus Cardinium hertigii]